jgi:hypothetical protein
MLKKLAAIGLGAALILSPVVTMAQTTPAPTETPAAGATPAAMPMKPMAHKVKHKAKAKHVVKKHVVKKHVVKKPAVKKPAPAEAPKS